MSSEDLKQLTGEIAQKYPALITMDEAAEIARVPVKTIYDWSSRELLDSIKSKRGRRVLLIRDGFVRFITGNSTT